MCMYQLDIFNRHDAEPCCLIGVNFNVSCDTAPISDMFVPGWALGGSC
jgi:hypothetical protein